MSLTPDQTALVDDISVAPGGDQTTVQGEAQAVRDFLWLCELEGCLPLPSEDKVRRVLRGRANAEAFPAV